MPLTSIAFEVPWSCPRCKGALLVNGVTESLLCPHCQAVVETPAAFWTDIIGDAVGYALRFEPGKTMTMSIMNRWGMLSLFYARLPVACECGGAIADDVIENALRAGASLRCPCGKAIAVRAAPAWFTAAVHPRIVGLAGERHAVDRASAADAAAVRFHCYGCAAPVPLDGRDRAVKCTYCGLDLVVPDPIWARLHPAETLQRWFALVR